MTDQLVTRTAVWEAPDPGTWSLDMSHQTDPVTATVRELLPIGFAEGFRRSFEPLGLPVSHLEAAFVNGWTYTSIVIHDAPRGASKPPPDLLLKVLSRIHPGFRRRTRLASAALANDHGAAEAERWFAERDDWVSRNLAFEDVDPWSLPDGELAAHVLATADHFRDGLVCHMGLQAPAVVVGEYLLAAKRWGIDMELAAKAVLHGTPTTVAANARLDAIATELGGARPSSLDEIRSHSARAAELLDDYLRHHGGWVLGDDLLAPRLVELPDVVLSLVAAHRDRVAEEHARSAAAIEAVRAAVPAAEHAEFERLSRAAQRAYSSIDDNSGITAAWPGGLARRAQLAAADRLVAAGRIEAGDHVCDLTPAEIAGLLTGASSPTTATIAERAAQRAWQATLTPPPFLGAAPTPPPDPSLFPEPVATLTARMLTYIGTKFGSSTTAVGIGDETVRGRAVVVASPFEAIERLEPGDILVTNTTTPAYNVILPLVGGLVTVFGGAGSHPAVVARELGVPAVIGCADALTRIADGAEVEVDPHTAEVRVVG